MQRPCDIIYPPTDQVEFEFTSYLPTEGKELLLLSYCYPSPHWPHDPFKSGAPAPLPGNCRRLPETARLEVSPGPQLLQVAIISEALSPPLLTSVWENLYFLSLTFLEASHSLSTFLPYLEMLLTLRSFCENPSGRKILR